MDMDNVILLNKLRNIGSKRGIQVVLDGDVDLNDLAGVDKRLRRET